MPPVNSGGVNWRRNLAALWFAEFMAIFGFSFAFPFLPIFLHQDLGVHQGTDLYLWTAASASASGISMAIASPIWGILGDRYGRKPMLVRSMVGGAITVGLIFFAQNPSSSWSFACSRGRRAAPWRRRLRWSPPRHLGRESAGRSEWSTPASRWAARSGR